MYPREKMSRSSRKFRSMELRELFFRALSENSLKFLPAKSTAGSTNFELSYQHVVLIAGGSSKWASFLKAVKATPSPNLRQQLHTSWQSVRGPLGALYLKMRVLR